MRIAGIAFKIEGAGYVLQSVRLQNAALDAVRIADWTLIHMTRDGVHRHTFKFPYALAGDSD